MTHHQYTNSPISGTVSLTLFRSEMASAVEAEQQAAFFDYAAAREKADETGKLEDGIAAGKAWARFVDLFVVRG